MARSGVSTDELTNDFNTATKTYRGVRYVLKELPITEYDELLKLATVVKTVDGEEQEVVDDATLVKLLTQKSIVEPRILRPLGTRLWRQLERDVQVLHFGVEPDETDAKDEDKKDEDEGEATSASS
jgi:hypothetical protein